MKNSILKTVTFNTPLGAMCAISDEKHLYLLEFADHTQIEKRSRRLEQKTHCKIYSGEAKPLISIERELQLYFDGKLKAFNTPVLYFGTEFQKRVWKELGKISYGKTKSYLEMALSIQHPSAFRAVALANASNQFAIIIPCHRVINASGRLGGYGGGVSRKKWLLNHEKKCGQ